MVNEFMLEAVAWWTNQIPAAVHSESEYGAPFSSYTVIVWSGVPAEQETP